MCKLNPEKVLTLLNELITQEKVFYADHREPTTYETINRDIFKQLKEYATEALYYEIANKKGGKVEETRRRAALKFLKDSKIKGKD